MDHHSLLTPRAAPGGGSSADDSVEARILRTELVRDLANRIHDVRVLHAMARVPRHLFVPHLSLRDAYRNEAAPIGHGQTISQPLVVGWMTEALQLEGDERVLEIGTGTGYQAAVLALLAAEVYTIEIVTDLADEARSRLNRLGFHNVRVRGSDGYAGWPDEAPFDRIIVTAAPEEVPATLFDQLASGGFLVAPVGPVDRSQRLLRYQKRGAIVRCEDLGAVRFVPLVRDTR
jgi:protein-L-isoaspartate(D-aspartate) O-methyltransferase